VGVAGARWITNEVDKLLLKESVKVAAQKEMSAVNREELVKGTPREVLRSVSAA
jgi:hypothetical protein